MPAPPPPSLHPAKGKVGEEEENLVEEIYVTSSSVIELDNCPSPAPTNTDGSDSGIYNASTDTGNTLIAGEGRIQMILPLELCLKLSLVQRLPKLAPDGKVMLQLAQFLAALTLNGVTFRLITFSACLLRISLLWSKFDSAFVAFYWPEEALHLCLYICSSLY